MLLRPTVGQLCMKSPSLPIFSVLKKQGLEREMCKWDPYPCVCIAHMMLGHTPSQDDHPCVIGSQHHVIQC